MRRLALPLLIAATLIAAGCSNSSSTPKAAAAPTAVSGSVSVIGDTALVGPGQLELQLVDVSKQPAAVVTQKTETITSLPAQFSLPFTVGSLDGADLYVLNASLQDSQRKFVAPIQYPVLTRGNPAQVAIQLKALPTAGEKAMDGFAALKARLGALKYTNGDQSEIGMSRGWQIFRDGDDQVVFIKELEDAGDKGFTSTEMTYRDGKPWVVVQQRAAARGQKPSLTERAGWDADGKLVLAERVAHGQQATLAAADAAALRQQAEAMLAKAGK